MTEFTCKECGAKIEQKGDEFIRSCSHKEAGIIASLKATATGESRVAL